MGQCNSTSYEIWLIDNGNFNKSTTVIDKEQTLKALLRTLTHITHLLKDRKVYVSYCCDFELIQPIVDYYNVIPVKSEEGMFSGLLSLNSATLCSDNSFSKCKDNSMYNNLQSDNKIKRNDNEQDLIYLLLIGDIPVYPELQLNLDDNCRCGYYKHINEENQYTVTLSGTVIRRSYLNMVLKSFSNVGNSHASLDNFIYNASIGRRGLQPMIKYGNNTSDIQLEFNSLHSQKESVTLIRNN